MWKIIIISARVKGGVEECSKKSLFVTKCKKKRGGAKVKEMTLKYNM
jgi:hypothetical protein